MAKLNIPLLSFSAKGTIANSLTFQKKSRGTIVRSKPTPTYTKTLPQQYQRWLYEDYCYLWRQQTSAVKAIYAQLAGRHHTTALSEWLRVKLTLLPDIAGIWHLDYIAAGKVIDSSKNANTGTVHGATSTSGVIDHALSFDIVPDDYVTIPHSPSLSFNYATWELLFYPTIIPTLAKSGLVAKDNYNNRNWYLSFDNTRIPHCDIWVDGTRYGQAAISTVPLNAWAHYAVTFDGSNIRQYVNGVLDRTTPAVGVLKKTTYPLDIGRQGNYGFNFTGKIDHVIIYNRVLDTTEIKRHSERRYPIQ